ncbi:MAG: Phosphoglycerate kinase Pgk [Microgenomates group bacterium GW2011_GWC1_37_12b]|uniref:Phosphoglycerate kinase n=1 Tax=Candidatus Woesebacteria bacterium GW2011_GWB1_38_8b TaxID=1618571 RepID=A0A0G0L4F6_9BACT|nr:MAG: Phosphoglycerate kinase Pgk [Microgenomates group bacterium GW2011_GWC1_37_12b]KKQ86863.1 MAG: Phosphoglycerate kinase Pgk [Candidatus Woesebacteria bacterium GW2011_GWB1_38_8b]
MEPKKLQDLDLNGKRVFVRADLDVPIVEKVNVFVPSETYRLEVLKDTVNYCISKQAAEVVIVGHMGRPTPEDQNNTKFSTQSLIPSLEKILGCGIVYRKIDEKAPINGVTMLENIRFYEGEEKNDPEFAKTLASIADVYVNEAFAVSHREHASIVGVPKLLPHGLGIWHQKEIENLSKAFENPQRPLVVLISGIKDDKIGYAKAFEEFADKILIGGKLPDLMQIDKSIRDYSETEKVLVANLTIDKFDITVNSIDRFKEEIFKAKTIILAGVLGKYEEEGHDQGTREVFGAVARAKAFKIVGGGDSLAAIEKYELKADFNWTSVGGGAMLEFLTKKTLPGIEALK